MKGVSGYEKQISCIWVDCTVSFTNPKSCFCLCARHHWNQRRISTEQKETVASSTKPSAATSAPSSSSNNEDKTAEKSSSTDSVEASKATAESESKEQPKKQARAAITDNIFSSVKMYKINGDEVQPNDTLPNMTGIKLALQFSFTNKNYQTGDTFTTQLPAQVAIAKDLSGSFSPMTSAEWSIKRSY